ncbi:MAG TPA: WbqC family protein [Bacteroidales bacterium]|nr:WbqC family protein [Bacteroidales bacterium]
MDNSHSASVLLSTAYLPSIEYIRAIANSGRPVIERYENYQKQSYRNRCYIYSSAGLLPLIIPICREDRNDEDTRRIDKVKIDYTKKWQKQHWRAIFSAYNSSPFFCYYKDEIYSFYTEEEPLLFNYNNRLLNTILDLIGISSVPEFTQNYIRDFEGNDYRNYFHPKKEVLFNNKYGQYYQVFAHKYGFIPNLSIIDLLFNEGPNSITFFF